MNLTHAFIRIFFFVLSIFFVTTYMVTGPQGRSLMNFAIGIASGSALGLALIGFDLLFKRFNLRAFNIAVLGLIFGYFMGLALVMILNVVLEISSASIHLDTKSLEIIKIGLFLFGIYLGTLMTLRASDELYISVPFVKFSQSANKKRDLVIDQSALADARIIDLAASGLVDNQLIIPRFLLKELYSQSEASDELLRTKAKRALEIVKKLEVIPDLCLRFNDTDFPEIKDPVAKIIRFARFLDAAVLTATISKIQMAAIEGVRFINIHTLSTALKPLMQPGEKIKIKIQHVGKEPRQGVGYLDDGSMVVVNGGGDRIGEVVEAHVISVRPGPAGRMTFCKIKEEEGNFHEYDEQDDQ